MLYQYKQIHLQLKANESFSGSFLRNNLIDRKPAHRSIGRNDQKEQR